jgi:drug/metabolite transporter (DMT)-like permease
VNRNRSQLLAGNGGAFVASCLFGASVVATRSVVDDVRPLNLAVLRFGQGSIILLVALALFWPHLLRVQRGDAGLIVLLGVIFFVLFPVAFNKSLTLTTASRGSVMLATMPLWTAFLGRWSHKETPSSRQLAGVLISIAGIVVVFVDGGAGLGSGRAMIGNGLMLFAALCGGLYNLLAKPLLDRYSAVTVTVYAMLTGAVILSPFGLAEGLPSHVRRLDTHDAALVLYLGIFGGALAYWLITFALSRLTPMLTTAYINLNPMVATLLGALLLDEVITWGFVVGFALVGTGLILANWPATRAAPQQSAAITGRL